MPNYVVLVGKVHNARYVKKDKGLHARLEIDCGFGSSNPVSVYCHAFDKTAKFIQNHIKKKQTQGLFECKYFRIRSTPNKHILVVVQASVVYNDFHTNEMEKYENLIKEFMKSE